MAKKRTPAQIRATKKLVAFMKARARKNAGGVGKKKKPSKRARQMKRAGKAVAAWARAGMPSVRNKGKKKQCNPHRKSGPKLTLAQGRRLYELGRKAPKTAVGLKRTKRGVSIVTGKAARKLKGQ